MRQILVTLISVFMTGCMYVILEYVPHNNLLQYLRNSRKDAPAFTSGEIVSNLEPQQLIKFAFGVAKGMMHLSACEVKYFQLYIHFYIYI